MRVSGKTWHKCLIHDHGTSNVYKQLTVRPKINIFWCICLWKITWLRAKNVVILAGGCCIPITLNSTLTDFVNNTIYPYYIAGTCYQSTLNKYNAENTFNSR
jgi:hypothetical protein